MGAFPAISLLLFTATALSCLVPSFASASAEHEDLGIQVCRNTSDFAFCRDAIYSNHLAPGADQYTLMDIVVRLAERNASDTKNHIAEEIKSRGDEGGGLKKCLANYEESDETLSVMLNDLNSETYYELDIRSLEVERNAIDCEKPLRGRPPLARMNQNMIKLSNICYLVSKLFSYN